MDFGAEYANYTSDLTRTVPVNGRFSDRQKSVYHSVLHVMKEATKMLVPGTIFKDYGENKVHDVLFFGRVKNNRGKITKYLKENGVRKIMRAHLKKSSFELWRKRVKGRKTKHRSTSQSIRFKSSNQK